MLFEALLGVAVCVVIGKVADADGRSPLAWGGLALALCLTSLLIPFPYARLILAGVLAFIIMFFYNLARPRW